MAKANPVDEHFHKETQEDIECLLQKLQHTKGPWYCFAWYATLIEEIMIKPLLIFGKPKFIETERSVVKSISIISVPDFPHYCDEFVKIL